MTTTLRALAERHDALSRTPQSPERDAEMDTIEDAMGGAIGRMVYAARESPEAPEALPRAVHEDVEKVPGRYHLVRQRGRR